MEFRLLGPLEARSHGRPLALGGPKQRAVFALLLLHANEVVSVERLIDELWGERPPKTVEAYIQNCISRLRKAIGRERVETRAPGYVLRAAEDEIDATRFEHAVAAARGLEPSERAAALREALALWHGPPLADVAFESFAQGEIARLEELRLAALEERLEAELRLGRHNEVLAELEALVNRHPTRERLRAHQLLALYRAGRQQEALNAYHEARLALVEEVGLEPSEELRALERMIIAHDPALDVAPRAPREEARAHEVRRNVAVLVVDLAVPEDLDPDAERRRTAGWLARIALAVERHGGVVQQLLGEEVVAAFGVPAAHEDDALRALRAAAELRAALAGEVDVRVAVEWGGVLSGQDRPAVAGAALSQPRRLVEIASAGDLMLGPAALRLVSAAVDVVPHDSGRGFRVLRFDPDADPFARRFDAPFVGRSDELARLETAFREVVESGSPRRVVVVGEPGIGKTRLAAELVTRVRRRARVLAGRCVAYGEGATFLPLVQILDQVGPLEEVLAGEPDAERVAARVRDRALSEKTEALWAVRRLLEVVARRRPVVVLLEDVHWAEPTFLDLVEYVAGWAQAPLLLVCLTRPELLEARPEWREDALTLAPLPADEARELAAALPGRPEQERIDAAVEAAEGNPLFLEQLLAAAEEQEEAGSVPPTLEALIASRLDRLPVGERAVLERAAVAGREFWRSGVDALTPEEERAAAGADLMALVRRRLVRPEQAALPGEDGFRFHHVLIRDVAYGAIPKSTRAELHERLGRWLDGRGDQLDELVGYHLEQAARLRVEIGEEAPKLAQEAGRRLGEAGMRALKRFDPRAAVNLLTRATELSPDDAARLELEWGLGTAVKFCGDAARADALLEEVVERARRRGDRRIELRARIEQAWPRLSRGEMRADEGFELLEEALPVFEAAHDQLALGRARHLNTALKGVYRLQIAEAEAAALQARQNYSRAGFATVAVTSLLAVAAHRGPTSVRDAIARCERLLAEIETPVWGSFVLPPLAALEAMTGNFELARSRLAEARAGREEFADAGTIVTSWSEIAAEVELLASNPRDAELILSDSVEVLRRSDDVGWLATNTALLAEALYRQDRFEEALVLSESARQTAPPGHLTSRSVAERVHAKSLARLGHLEEAVSLAYATVASLSATDALDERAEALVALGEAYALQGDLHRANESWQQAVAQFEEKGNVVSAERVRNELVVRA